MQLLLSCALALGLGALAAPLSSQDPDAPPLRVAVHGRDLVGSGPGYTARFTQDAFEITPHGEAAVPLRFTLQSVGRRGAGGERLTPVGDGARTADGRRVHYTRPQVVETYELRADGVEQSFAFAALPAGEGDLVVVGRVDSALHATRVAADGVQFTAEGRPAVAFGAVTGIDADGTRAAGTLRLTGDRLELALPEAFVAGARLPLVLDPLIGSVFTIASSADAPDVAYDGITDRYLVVWDYSPIVGTAALRGLRYASNGAPVGAVLTLKSGGAPTNPRVCAVDDNGTGWFVVAWEENGDIRAVAVNASTGALTNEVPVATGSDVQTTPAIGGGVGVGSALIVWDNDTQNAIEGAPVTVAGTFFGVRPGGTIATGSTTFLRFVGSPSVSRSEGGTLRHLVTWTTRSLVGLNATQTVSARVCTTAVTLLGPALTIADTTKYRSNPAVDGDGREWMVAWENSSGASSTDHDIAACTVVFDPHQSAPYVAVPERTLEGDVGDDEIQPWVANLGASYVVGYADADASGLYDAYAKSVDPAGCLDCEGEVPLDVGTADMRFARAVGRISGGNNVDDGLFVWRSGGGGFLGSLRGHRFDPQGVALPHPTASCGDGGLFRATCARLGHLPFAFRLQGAAPNQPAFLVLSGYARIASCNTCTLAPDPFRGLVLAAGATDAHGAARIDVPIPAVLPVAQFYNLYAQWLVSNPAAACSLGFDMSNSIGLIVL